MNYYNQSYGWELGKVFADKSKLFRLDDQQDFGGGEGLRFTWLWRQTVSASSQFALTQHPSHLLNPTFVLPPFKCESESVKM